MVCAYGRGSHWCVRRPYPMYLENCRKGDRRLKKIVFVLTALLMLLGTAGLLTGCGGDSIPENTVHSIADLAGKTIGSQLGTTGYIYAEEEVEGATVEPYNKGADAIQALKQGKLDAVIIDNQPAQEFVTRNDGTLRILEEPFVEEEYAIAYQKENTALGEKLDAALTELKEEGTLEVILSHWIGDEADKVSYMPDENASRENGTLVMATNAEFPPYESMENGKVVGIDVDMMQAVCDKLGMTLEVENMEFDSIIAAVQSGKADVGVAGMTVTPDREKNVSFTQGYAIATQVVIVRSDEGGAQAGFFQNIGEKLHSTFVENDRWIYLVDGLKTTLIITFFAVILGMVLGFMIAIVRATHDKTGKLKLCNLLAKLYLTVIRGTPVVVQLLIIYFVIFASVNVDKTVVAVLAFGLNSAAYVAEIVRSGIMAIDNGQFEAGASLGLNYPRTMVSIVLPQACKNVLPALANECIVLLKETSVAGYIAIADLTKGGDIIRSQTYEAFLPLIAVALIYLVMVLVLSTLVNRLERRLAKHDRG